MSSSDVVMRQFLRANYLLLGTFHVEAVPT